MIGKIILVIVLVLAALLLTAVIRTVLLKADAPSPRKPCSRNEAELEKLGQDFARLIQVPTYSYANKEDSDRFEALHAQIDALFPLVTGTFEKTVLEDEVLLYHWKGKDPDLPALLLMGHQDVVPVNEKEWTYPPFAGEIHDGKIYGRGVNDDKCNIFCQLQAAEELLKEGFVPAGDIWFVYGTNEESSGPSAAHAVQWLKDHDVHLACAFDEGGAVVDKAMAGMDRPYAVIGITEKGYADVKITAVGEGGHSSAPRSSTTMTRLADFMHDVNHSHLYECKFTPHVRAMFTNMAPSFGFGMRLLFGNLWLFEGLLTKLMPKISSQGAALLGTTICFTEMKGSDVSNVIPTEASVVANLRIGYTQNLEESLALLKKKAEKYDLTMEVLSSREASPVTPQDTEIYQYLTDCVRKQFPDCGVSPYVMMGGTDNRHYASVTKNCLRFYPLRLTSSQLGTMHSKDENVDLASLSDVADFYRYFMANWKGEH
jgi:carboxypeptidase PM20D1